MDTDVNMFESMALEKGSPHFIAPKKCINPRSAIGSPACSTAVKTMPHSSVAYSTAPIQKTCQSQLLTSPGTRPDMYGLHAELGEPILEQRVTATSSSHLEISWNCE